MVEWVLLWTVASVSFVGGGMSAAAVIISALWVWDNKIRKGGGELR